MALWTVAWVTDYPIQAFDVTLSLQRQSNFYLVGAYPRFWFLLQVARQ
jgi:hypothetical protein